MKVVADVYSTNQRTFKEVAFVTKGTSKGKVYLKGPWGKWIESKFDKETWQRQNYKITRKPIKLLRRSAIIDMY